MATNAAGGTGKASDKTTSANIGVGEDKPKVLDAQGAIGHAFTGKDDANGPNCNPLFAEARPSS